MSPDDRAHLLAGSAYVNPTEPWQPWAERTFGESLRMVHQSYEDITQPGEAERRLASVLRDLYQQTATLAQRIAVLEAQNALLWAILGREL